MFSSVLSVISYDYTDKILRGDLKKKGQGVGQYISSKSDEFYSHWGLKKSIKTAFKLCAFFTSGYIEGVAIPCNSGVL